jgi:hypothetical protein
VSSHWPKIENQGLQLNKKNLGFTPELGILGAGKGFEFRRGG